MTAITKAYELHVFARAEWRIDRVLGDMEAALDEARQYAERLPTARLRVVEERFDSDRNQATSLVVFEHPTPTKNRAEAFFERRRRPPSPVRRERKDRPRRRGFALAFEMTALVAGWIAVGGLIALAYLASRPF